MVLMTSMSLPLMSSRALTTIFAACGYPSGVSVKGMGLNIVENLVRQQIAGGQAVGEQFADWVAEMASWVMAKVTTMPAGPARRAAASSHRRSVNSVASSCGRLAVSTGKPGRCETAMCAMAKQVAPAVPGRQSGEGIGPDQQDEAGHRPVRGAGVPGMHRCSSAGGWTSAGIDRKQRIAGGARRTISRRWAAVTWGTPRCGGWPAGSQRTPPEPRWATASSARRRWPK